MTTKTAVIEAVTPQAAFTLDGIYEPHFTDLATAISVAKANDARNGRAFTFDGTTYTQVYPVLALTGTSSLEVK